jgi:Tfp pilus assembly protein PilZ
MDSLSAGFSKDRRFVKRHNIKTALRVRIWKSDVPEKRAESVNLSQRGIFFATDSLYSPGEVVGILLKMPEEVTGEPTTEWRCTGPVVRIETIDSPKGRYGVGVQFYCYDVSRAEQPPMPAALARLMPVQDSATARRRASV